MRATGNNKARARAETNEEQHQPDDLVLDAAVRAASQECSSMLPLY
jgi:hypothetical protein